MTRLSGSRYGASAARAPAVLAGLTANTTQSGPASPATASGLASTSTPGAATIWGSSTATGVIPAANQPFSRAPPMRPQPTKTTCIRFSPDPSFVRIVGFLTTALLHPALPALRLASRRAVAPSTDAPANLDPRHKAEGGEEDGEQSRPNATAPYATVCSMAPKMEWPLASRISIRTVSPDFRNGMLGSPSRRVSTVRSSAIQP